MTPTEVAAQALAALRIIRAFPGAVVVEAPPGVKEAAVALARRGK